MATARTVLAIVNPKTGRRPIDHFIEPLSQEAARRGILLRVVVTTSPGEATILAQNADCLLYTSDAADERSSVDLGGRRIIKKKKSVQHYGRGLLEKDWRGETSTRGAVIGV